MSMDDMGNGEKAERIPSLAEEILEDLQAVSQALRELAPMQTTIAEDIALIQAEVERIQGVLANWDENAERMRETGELQEHMPLSRDIGRAMNSLSISLERLINDHSILLDTRMLLEVTIQELNQDAQALLAKYPEDKKQ